jgi:catechol 2,3-dioxygenase-like lactoylglutathione lyase family enzyme
VTAQGIKILDIAYPRLRAPDLDAMEVFLTEFGLVKAARTANALYMRGTGPAHHLHITERGEPGFVSLAYYARSEDDLHRIAEHPDATTGVHAIDEPGGGKRVFLKEPTNGFRIEIVHGIEKMPELPVTYRSPTWDAETMTTIGDAKRLRFGPAHVRRISHGVVATPHLKPTQQWFVDTLGLLSTDEFYMGSRDNLVGGFFRLDRGDDPVDHHVLNVYWNPKRAGLQHASFVVENVEDLLIGHAHLTRLNKWHHERGVGYHPPGGQIFDYWINQYGQMHELYLPTQQFTTSDPTNIMPAPSAVNPESAFANTLMDLVELGIVDE